VKRAKLRQWLKHGSIHVNGRSITRFDHALQIGDVVSIRTKKEVLAEAILPPALKVLFEDSSLIVVVKPESLLSMPSETERHTTEYAC
jgi:23S rRNA pseudouridine1911/1915/1917 synthase